MNEIHIMCLVEKQETVQGHVTLDLEGMSDQRKFEWMENLYGILHGTQVESHGLLDIGSCPLKRGGGPFSKFFQEDQEVQRRKYVMNKLLEFDCEKNNIFCMFVQPRQVKLANILLSPRKHLRRGIILHKLCLNTYKKTIGASSQSYNIPHGLS